MFRAKSEWASKSDLRFDFGGDFEAFWIWSLRSGYSELRICRKRYKVWVWGMYQTKLSVSKHQASVGRLKERAVYNCLGAHLKRWENLKEKGFRYEKINWKL